MKSSRPKEKGRVALPAATVKRVVVDFPTPLLARAERAVAEMDTNRSALIRTAVEQYLELLQKAKLEQALAEGYAANAAQARRSCEEFAHVDSDLA
jgi:metal-responsive CopG/Arc/MetJ family transcriptional regulator